MTTIYKYPLRITDEQIVPLPRGAKILTAQMQGETLCLWAEVSGPNTQKNRIIEIFGTGHPMNQNYNRRYIGTVQQMGGGPVWHIYERE